MNKVRLTLNNPKFERILLIWSCPATNRICVRDKMTGKTKIIELV